MGFSFSYQIELAASLNVRLVFASNELLSVLASLCQTPDSVFAQGRFGKRQRTLRVERILTEVRKIRLISVESIFQTHIDRLARLISELFHLEIKRYPELKEHAE